MSTDATGRPIGWTDWIGRPIPDRAIRSCARTERHTPHPHGVTLWCEGRDSFADAAGRLPGCPCGLTGRPLPDGSALAGEPYPGCPHHRKREDA
jgi:hypothetical protein